MLKNSSSKTEGLRISAASAMYLTAFSQDPKLTCSKEYTVGDIQRRKE